MADQSGISWCDSSLSLWHGCTQISPACDHCYAMRIAHRLKVKWNAPPRIAADSAWRKIGAWQRGAGRFIAANGHPRRAFINHLSDFFDNQAPQEWRTRACLDFEQCPDVIIILVTKRPQNVASMVPRHWLKAEGWPPHVWLLVTGENQAEFDRRIAWLYTIPGVKVRGVSIEPMLEPIDVRWTVAPDYARVAYAQRHLPQSMWSRLQADARLGWAIIGGESGSGARPMPYDSAAAAVREFGHARVPVFVKQLSQADRPKKGPAAFDEFDSFPAALRVREFPA